MALPQITDHQYRVCNKLYPTAEEAIEKFRTLHKRLKDEPQNTAKILAEIDEVQRWYEYEIS